MNRVLEQMLDKYEAKTLDEKKNAIKEVVQEIILCGLSKSGFFSKAAFYGGTALRIFHHLDRFSEDLDFSLLDRNPNFSWKEYLPYIEREIQSMGLNFVLEEKEKKNRTNVQSAFAKGNTKACVMTFFEADKDIRRIHPDEVIRIKFEVDINPPQKAKYEWKTGLLPSPYQALLFDTSCLFASKITACLCRNYSERVKGRDFYDFLYFLALETKFDLAYLESRLIQFQYIDKEGPLTLEKVKELLMQKFETIDFEMAKRDVLPFIRDKSKLDLWNKEFFLDLTQRLLTC